MSPGKFADALWSFVCSRPVDDQVNLAFVARAGQPETDRGCLTKPNRPPVRVNSTRQPFSTSAKPMAEARWVLPPPGQPMRIRLAPLPIQLSPAQIGTPGGMAMIGGWGDRQHLADRLDPMFPALIVDERDHGLCRRSSSVRAKYADALRRISLYRPAERLTL